MTCKDLAQHIPDYLDGTLTPSLSAEAEAHLSSCGRCRREVEELRRLQAELGDLPTEHPRAALKQRFYAALDSSSSGGDQSESQHAIVRAASWLASHRWVMQAAAAVILFAAGLLTGSRSGILSDQNEITEMRREIHDLNRLVVLNLLEQPSASNRLKGISRVYDMREPDETVIDALLTVLSEDPSVNIRLASVEALHEFKDLEFFRTKLITALLGQTSPVVQIGIIEFLVSVRERRAVIIFREMLRNENLDHSVRERLELAITQLRAPII